MSHSRRRPRCSKEYLAAAPLPQPWADAAKSAPPRLRRRPWAFHCRACKPPTTPTPRPPPGSSWEAAVSGASRPCSRPLKGSGRSFPAMRAAPSPTRPTSRSAAARPATRKWSASASTRPSSASRSCSTFSGRRMTRPRSTGRGPTTARSTARSSCTNRSGSGRRPSGRGRPRSSVSARRSSPRSGPWKPFIRPSRTTRTTTATTQRPRTAATSSPRS